MISTLRPMMRGPGERAGNLIDLPEQLFPAEPSSMKSYPKIIDRIIEGIRESHTICVVGHIRPDGDCVGSQLGLTMALRNEGKKVVCWNEDRMPQKYEFLDPDKILQKPKRGMKFDCVIATDAASFERFGSVGPCIGDRKLFINIDHHESNTRYADLNWVSAREPSSASCSQQEAT